MTLDEVFKLAFQRHQEGKLAEAETTYRQVLAADPHNADALNNLGLIALQRERFDVAIQLIRRALVLQPATADFHNNIGDALRRSGRLSEAADSFRAAIRLNAAHAGAVCNLGITVQMLGDFAQARACYEQALRLAPAFPYAHLNLGCLLKEEGRVAEARECFERALALNPHLAEAHNNLGNVLKDQGQISKAITCYREALRLRPSYLNAYSGLLLALVYSSEHDPAVAYSESREFARRFEAPLHAATEPHRNSKDPTRRLRVGYVSGDLRRHPVARFMEPILAQYDHNRFSVICYYAYWREDDVTRRLRSHTDAWIDITRMTDEQAAAQIREDGIDILVDLSGHTANNRLLVFARKPAPIQVTYLGYLGTTGLDAMDFRITDAYLNTNDSERNYTERPLVLPDCMWCFKCPQDRPSVSAAPCLTNGRVTFGSLNNVAKINSNVIALWSRVLARAPTTRLLMATISPGEVRSRLLAEFGRHGIDQERVEFADWLPESEFFKLHARIDVALDPFPCNGGTTTCETLWAGIPVVTLAGSTVAGRAGVSLLSNAGLKELIAGTPEEYVDIAVRLAADPAGIASRRAGLRPKVAASRLADEVRFVRSLEAAYRQCWHGWCSQAPKS